MTKVIRCCCLMIHKLESSDKNMLVFNWTQRDVITWFCQVTVKNSVYLNLIFGAFVYKLANHAPLEIQKEQNIKSPTTFEPALPATQFLGQSLVQDLIVFCFKDIRAKKCNVMSTYTIILRFAKKPTVYLNTFILLNRMGMRFKSQKAS